jgi:hypothetical protein
MKILYNTIFICKLMVVLPLIAVGTNEMRWTESGRKFIHELLISKGLRNRQKSIMI